MNEKNEKLEELLNSLRERNMTLEDLKPSGESFDDEEEIELLDDDDNDQSEEFIDDNSFSNVTLREDNSKEVDLGDFF